jgi:YD repeat-containing protein
VITRNVKVGTTWTGTAVAETTFATTERYDRQGRLYQLLEASGLNNATTTITYGYDVGNRLKTVSMPSQTRTFNYDNRGFLTSKVHPESGTTSYGSYDARGHAGTRSTGAASLAYTYDRAERLTQVQETSPVNRTLKAWTWATANSGSDYRNGKVLYATRNLCSRRDLEEIESAHTAARRAREARKNYVTIGATPFKVSFFETFTYAGRDGRVSQRVLSQYTNDGAVSESFTQSWTYDVLGNPITVGYPAPSPPAPPHRGPSPTPTPRASSPRSPASPLPSRTIPTCRSTR